MVIMRDTLQSNKYKANVNISTKNMFLMHRKIKNPTELNIILFGMQSILSKMTI